MNNSPRPSFQSENSVRVTNFDVFLSYTGIGRHINKLINVS